MKNYKSLVPIILVLLVVFGIYYSVDSAIKTNATYQNTLESAREASKRGVVQKAIENYENALTIKPSAELYWEYMDFIEQKQGEEIFTKYLQNVYLSKFPKDDKAYEKIAKFQLDNRNYQKFFTVYNQAAANQAVNQNLHAMYESTTYATESTYKAITADYIAPNSSGYGIWLAPTKGLLTPTGGRNCVQYDLAGPYFSDVFPVVAELNGAKKAFFANNACGVAMTSDEIYDEFGTFSNGVFPAKKDGKWQYLNDNFRPAVEGVETDLATGFYNDIAAIGSYSNANGQKYGDFTELLNNSHQNVNWKVIDIHGKAINDDEYADVKINSAGLIAGSGRFFAQKKGDKWRMYDTNGREVKTDDTNDGFDDCAAFNSKEQGQTALAAVKKGDKWGFVDANGKLQINYQAEEAKSFLNDLAPISNAQHIWGYINPRGELAIDYQFAGAETFTADGYAIVSPLSGGKKVISLVKKRYNS
jgi:hypothetical protein